jgi:hypothetical protein
LGPKIGSAVSNTSTVDSQVKSAAGWRQACLRS